MKFCFRIVDQFSLFAIAIGCLGIRLGTDGDVFPEGHGHRAGAERRDAGCQDRVLGCAGSSYSDQQRGGGHEAIIRSENCCPEPPRASGTVPLEMRSHVRESSNAFGNDHGKTS